MISLSAQTVKKRRQRGRVTQTRTSPGGVQKQTYLICLESEEINLNMLCVFLQGRWERGRARAPDWEIMANELLFLCRRRRQRSKLLTGVVYTCSGREPETRHIIIALHQIRQQMELECYRAGTQSRHSEIMFLCKQSLYCHNGGNMAILASCDLWSVKTDPSRLN